VRRLDQPLSARASRILDDLELYAGHSTWARDSAGP
jgi:hypothetical protein